MHSHAGRGSPWPVRLFPALFFPTCATSNRRSHKPQESDNKMPDKVVETPYPLIDADPHFNRVVRYMRLSDYAVWAGATAAFPSALYFWGESIHLPRPYNSRTYATCLAQRWPIPQSRVYGQLYASVASSVSLVAFYLPTNAQAVSLCFVRGDHADTQRRKSAFGGGQRTSMRKKGILPN